MAVKSAAAAGDTASPKAVNMSCKHESPTLQHTVVVKTAAAGRAASAEAAGSSGKRKADGQQVYNPLKVANVARVAQGYCKETDATVPQAKAPVGGAPASDKADTAHVAANYNFSVDHFGRAFKAVDELGLKWTTRQQRVILRRATMEQRAIAFLLAERLFVANIRQWAALNLYWNMVRATEQAKQSTEACGVYGVAHTGCPDIKDSYKQACTAGTATADAIEMLKAAVGSAGTLGQGKGEAVVSSVGAAENVKREAVAASPGVVPTSKAAAASAGVASSSATGKGKGKAVAASAAAPSTGDAGRSKRAAAAASAADTNDDDVVIVNFILAKPMKNATKEEGSTAAGAVASSCFIPVPHTAVRDNGKISKQEPLLSRTASRVAAAASAAGVVGYGDLDFSGPAWAAWVSK